MKHVELDLYFVRDKVSQGVATMNFVSAHAQFVAIFTKPLT